MTIRLDASAVGLRLSLCAAAIAGTAATAPLAHASIITFSPALVVPQTLAGVYINLLTGATGASAGAVVGWDFNPYNSNGATQLGFYWAPTPVGTSGGVDGGTGQYLDLAPGTLVGPGSAFLQSINSTNAFRTTGTHTLGFRFLNEGTAVINYGYMTLTNTATTGFPTTIQSWSFENTGVAISVPGGGVPEPASLALTSAGLALGAIGMRRWRRRKA